MLTFPLKNSPAFVAACFAVLLLATPVFAGAAGSAPAAENGASVGVVAPDTGNDDADATADVPTGVARPLPAPAKPAHAAAASSAAIATSGVRDYVLGVGDKLNITVFNEKDLSGEFEVSSTGIVSMPLIGDVQAAHHTVAEVQDTIAQKLGNGYMRNPHVSVEVANYRPFFILGEVMKPGSYNYVNGMSVITAVALAGGYTYRADKDDISVKHAGSDAKEETVKETTTVLPGDVINVPERYF
ncbi:MAG: polysaccharide export protein [Alphaproteobacteria bacterium]|nr:polysaccharide export protein [Alphaproteobacteria bacterium]